MTDQNPFEAMMKMGEGWAKAMKIDPSLFDASAFEKLWPTMPKDTMEMFFGKGVNPEGLDSKTRLLLTLAGLTVLGAQAESQIRLTVRHAIEAGATRQEVAETIAQMGLFGGVPAMQKAMSLANDVFDKDDTA